MADTITKAIDALTSAAFIEGGVSIERTDEARERTEQRKRELIEAIAACHPQAVAAQAAPAEVAVPDHVYTLRVNGRLHDYTPTLIAFDLSDGEHKLYTEQQVRPLLAALPATEDSSAGDLAEPTKLGLWEELNQRHLDLLQDVLDAKEVMAAAGIVQNDFASMFKLFAAQAEVQAEPVAVRDEIQRLAQFADCATRMNARDMHNNMETLADELTKLLAALTGTAAPQAQPADALDAREVVGDLAYALELLVGTDAMHSLCQQEAMDVLGRVKGTWSAAAEANARATLKTHAATLAAMAAAQEGGNAAKEA